nr:hypothetical protein [Sciscionella marina]
MSTSVAGSAIAAHQSHDLVGRHRYIALAAQLFDHQPAVISRSFDSLQHGVVALEAHLDLVAWADTESFPYIDRNGQLTFFGNSHRNPLFGKNFAILTENSLTAPG